MPSTGHRACVCVYLAGTTSRQCRWNRMPQVVGIDHLVLSVSDLARSKDFYDKVLGFLGFKLKHDSGGVAGWRDRQTLFWIAAADSPGKWRRHRKGDNRLHYLAFEPAERQGQGHPRRFFTAQHQKGP